MFGNIFTEFRQRPLSSYFTIKGRRSLYLYCVLTGIVSGLGALLFSRALAWAEYISLESISGLHNTHSGGEYFSGADRFYLFRKMDPFVSSCFGRFDCRFSYMEILS